MITRTTLIQAHVAVFLLVGLLVLCPGRSAAQEGGLGVWRVMVALESTREQVQQRLPIYADIEEVQVLQYRGRWGIFIGSHATEGAARQAADALLSDQGVPSQGVVFFPSGSDARPSPPSEGDAKYRVQVGQFSDRFSAQARASQLVQQGLSPVDVEEDGGRFRVLAGFEYPTEEEALAYARSLSDLGFAWEQVVDISAPPARTTPPPSPNYRRRIDEAIAAGNSEAARSLLNEWARAEPGDPAIARYGQRIQEMEAPREEPDYPEEREVLEERRAQARAAESRGDLATAIGIWQEISRMTMITSGERQDAQQNVSRLRDLEYQQPGGQREGATAASSSQFPYLLIAVFGGAALLLAVAGILFFKMRGSRPRPSVTAQTAGAGGLASATTGGLSMGGGMMPPPPARKAPARESSQSRTPAPVSKPEVAEEPKEDSDDSVKLNFDQEELPPPDEDKTEVEHVPAPSSNEPRLTSASSVSIPPPSGASKQPRAMGDDRPIPPPGGGGDDTQVEGFEFAGKQGASGNPRIAGKPATPSADRQPIPIVRDEASEKEPRDSDVPDRGASDTQVEGLFEQRQEHRESTQVELAHPGQKQADRGTAGKVFIYRGDFADAEIGKAPKGWEGSYEYATLQVARSDGDPGGKYLKFEKTSGSGSACYSCQFPNASGRINVEFDIRCDHKNKYLLGFYVEKDADFRHAVHTVVHGDAANKDKVSLRLQNEPVAYTLGQWVHIRFLIDLPRSIVDCHADGKSVGVGMRLASRPKVMNTLSIRDNLATEGVLLVRNIQIYQERS